MRIQQRIHVHGQSLTRLVAVDDDIQSVHEHSCTISASSPNHLSTSPRTCTRLATKKRHGQYSGDIWLQLPRDATPETSPWFAPA